MTITRSTGLVDKLNGIKTDLITEGTFESSAAAWTAAASTKSTPTGGVTGNYLVITNSGAASGSVYQDVSGLIVGRIYRLTINFKKGSAVSGSVKAGTTASPALYLTSPALTDADWAEYSFAFVATNATARITLVNDSTTAAETAGFDSVSLEECLDGFIEIMRNCKCNIYSGTKAADADMAAGTNVLATVTLNETATGLTFTTSSNGVVGKPPSEIWKGNINVTGTATWFRFYASGDDPNTTSTTAARFDGTVGTGGTDMIVGSTTLTLNLKFEITGFSYTAPK